MLRLFRSISRGRRKGQHDDAWSAVPSSPETSRHRTVGQNRAADDFSDEEDNNQTQPLSPHQRASGMPSIFPRHYRHSAGRAIETRDHEDEIDNEDEEDEGEDEDAEDAPLLPIFSAAHLDKLPLYNITHAIRLLIVQRCETTLSWDQLRSPQISQFLVKPIQSQIRSDHFNRATLCALIANCLQFRKEGQLYPGNVGVLRTRALISELLAMRLLREFTTRELIDALSYDFDPLQGVIAQGNVAVQARSPPQPDIQTQRVVAKGARLSTIEIAIRAEAKRFLAHPLVVQHLEAIWAGNIVFQSKADNLHRKQRHSLADFHSRNTGYGTLSERSQHVLPAKSRFSRGAHGSSTSYNLMVDDAFARRIVTLYNPRYASLFKLSRLRVPRYRQVFSTFSFATMLGLFLAVLVERSTDITPLEVVFWLWSAGYMLDEVVGFTEQGFGLYLLSFWNAFDIGILLLFAVYYCLRLYSIVLGGDAKLRVAGMAYDVLASTAILLFPRLFSILDHYRYFSQLLIAFRLMTQDLIAVFILILISISGFFVAFTFGMSKTRSDPYEVAYVLFQMVMGFTPAAWDNWTNYNVLGQILLAALLIICHFLVVTILITVLTNSFMAIVKNAEEEHQFLFAVNTISMVKSDALFSYIAPSNIIGWVLSPLRFMIPLRQYIKFNRTIIKITHFPVLFIICGYERFVMARSAFTPSEFVARPPRREKQPVAFTLNKAAELLSPGPKLREPSLMSFDKDRALDEVFRRPFRGDTLRTTTKEMDPQRRGSTTAVDRWMQAAENEGGAAPPLEQPRSVLERLENRRPPYKRAMTSDRLKLMQRSREFSTATKSVASDPDATSLLSARKLLKVEEGTDRMAKSTENLPQETDADGDDEINEHSDHPTPTLDESAISIPRPKVTRPPDDSDSDSLPTPAANKTLKQFPSLNRHVPEQLHGTGNQGTNTPSRVKVEPRKLHERNYSNGTILFAPRPNPKDYDSSESNLHRPSRTRFSPNNIRGLGNTPPGILLPSEHPSRTKVTQVARPRPALPTRQKTAPAPMKAGFRSFINPEIHHASLNTRALDLASEIGDNRWGPSSLADIGAGAGGGDGGGGSGGGGGGGGGTHLPSIAGSFSEQLMRERERQRRAEDARRRTAEGEETGMVSRILLTRMATLEEGFREILREVKDLGSQAANSASRRESDGDDSAFFAPGGGMSIRGVRSRGETGTSSLSASAQMARTGIGKGEGKKVKSPRKSAVRKESKRKSKEFSAKASEEGEEAAVVQPSPNSVLSVIELAKEMEGQDPV